MAESERSESRPVQPGAYRCLASRLRELPGVSIRSAQHRGRLAVPDDPFRRWAIDQFCNSAGRCCIKKPLPRKGLRREDRSFSLELKGPFAAKI